MREDDVFVEKIAGRKADAKRHDKSQYIRGDGDKAQVDEPLVQDIMVADEIHKDIKQGVRTPAHGIAEGLQRHQLAEGRIEEINEICKIGFHHNSPLP